MLQLECAKEKKMGQLSTFSPRARTEKFLLTRLIIKEVEFAPVDDLTAKQSKSYFKKIGYPVAILVFVILLFLGFYLYTETESHTLGDWIVIAKERGDYALFNEMLQRALMEGVGLDEVITIRPNWLNGLIVIGLSGAYGFLVFISLVVRTQAVQKRIMRIMAILSTPTQRTRLSSGQIKCPFCASSKVEFVGITRYLCSECGKEFRVIDAESLLFYLGLARRRA